jgi:hypothetical protein
MTQIVPGNEEAERLRRALKAWCATADDNMPEDIATDRTPTEGAPKDNSYDANRIG